MTYYALVTDTKARMLRFPEKKRPKSHRRFSEKNVPVSTDPDIPKTVPDFFSHHFEFDLNRSDRHRMRRRMF